MRRWLAVALLALTATGAVSWQRSVPAWKGDMAQLLTGLEPLKTYILRWVGDGGGVVEFCEAASEAGTIEVSVPDGPATIFLTGEATAVPEDEVRDGTELRIVNVKGQLVYSHDIKQDEFQNWNWDGKDNKGRRVASGVYFFELGARKGKVVIVR